MHEPATTTTRLNRFPSKRYIAALTALMLTTGVPLVLTGISTFLTLWILIPAPNFFLLRFGVVAPEISPWLIGLNTIAAAFAALNLHKSWVYLIALSLSLLSLIISSLPLMQLPSVHRQMTEAMQTQLGANYLERIPAEVRSQLRSQPFRLLDALRGISLPEIRRTTGIHFAQPDGVALTLNVYRPLKAGINPTIVVIYGGAWNSGTPDNDEQFSHYMAAHGYTVVAIDYRHAPKFVFPAQLEDVRSALAYIHTHAVELEVDVARLAIMGRSAGAQLAMVAAYEPDAPPVRAVVNYYGPVELTVGYHDPPKPDPIDTQAVLRAYLGGTPEQVPDRYDEASPYHYATQPQPLTLLVYAKHDHLVQAKFGRTLYNRLQKANSPAIYLEIPWAEHAFDAVFNGVSNQLALYHTERFLAWALQPNRRKQAVIPLHCDRA